MYFWYIAAEIINRTVHKCLFKIQICFTFQKSNIAPRQISLTSANKPVYFCISWCTFRIVMMSVADRWGVRDECVNVKETLSCNDHTCQLGGSMFPPALTVKVTLLYISRSRIWSSVYDICEYHGTVAHVTFSLSSPMTGLTCAGVCPVYFHISLTNALMKI